MRTVGNEPLSPDLDQALVDLNRRRFKTYTPESLAWLALPPAWTENLASVCSFPVGSVGLNDFLEKAVKAKLCARDPETNIEEASCESARTLAALWPYLNSAYRADFSGLLETLALAIPDREEGIYLLIFTRSNEGASPDKTAWLNSLIAELPDPEVQARLLLQVALHFGRPEDLVRAWEAADSIRVDLKRVMARVALLENASSIPSFSWDKRVTEEEVRKLSDPGQRAALLLKLKSLYPGAYLQPGIEAAVAEVADPSVRALYLSLLAKTAPGSGAGARAFEIASTLPDAAVRCRTLATIAVNCGEALADQALNLAWASALNVRDSGERTALLVLTASQWALLQGEAAFSRASVLNTAECRAEVMLACLSAEPLRNPATADIISNAIEEIPLESLRARLQLRLASLAPFRLLPDVLNRARSNQDDAERRNALLALLPRLDDKERGTVASGLLDDLRRVGDATVKRSALIQLVPFLDDRQVRIAIQIATDSRPDRGFRAEETARRDIVDYLRKEKGALFVYNFAYDVGQAIAGSKNVGVPTGTARWAQIASLLRDPNRTTIQRIGAAAGIADTPPTSGAGAFLTNQVRALVDAGNTGSALAWLSTGQLLAPIAGGDVESAVLTGTHRVELSYRRAMDERHLRRYLERDEQTSAFVRLRDEPDGPESRWALHFLGVGGVGKTMLLRHIAARLAVKDGRRLATTRVDFDHISPEFPVRKPGQLLAELADELRIYGGSSRIEDKFDEFQDRLLALHAELSAQPPPEDPLKNVKSPEFQELVSSFADLLRLLPPPVILILDTCEELSKLEPVFSTLPSVEATFAILERLQKAIPSIRVVFAGRRLLAKSGDSDTGGDPGWRAAAGAMGERNRYLPKHQKYLRLHVIRGFTGLESDRFLEKIADVRLDDDRKSAILDRSTEIAKPIEIQWAETRIEDAAPRYNPFDLALYAEWLRESPSVSAATIRSGQTEPYVEMRIVRRLENEPLIRRALPAAVLLRRFDDEMLRSVAPDDAARALLFRDLQGHEWTDSMRDEDLSTWFLEVNRNLRSRIESYFSAPPQRPELDRMREQLGPVLDQRVRAGLQDPQWFNQLNFTRVEPALRLQPPEAAAWLWDAIDQRVTATAEWNWAFRICSELLGEGNAAGDLAAPLRAAIRATLNAALLHLQRDFDPLPAWREVAQTAAAHPVPEIGAWLAYRADTFLARDIQALRALAAQHKDRSQLGPYRYEQAAAGLMARVYELGARIESAPEHWPRFGLESASELLLLQGLVFSRGSLDGPDLFVPDLPQVTQRWADWRIPDCLTDRARLEEILPTSATGTSATRTASLDWAKTAAGRLNNIDSERLLSALLDRQWFEATPDLLLQITASQYYDPTRVETCAAHRAARSLYVALAEQWRRLGNTKQALNVVAKVREIMLEARQPKDTLAQLDALQARLTEPPVTELATAILTGEFAVPAAQAPAGPNSNLRWVSMVLLGLTTTAGAGYALYLFVRWVLAGPDRLSYLGVSAGIIALWFIVPAYRKAMLITLATVIKPKLVLSESGEKIQASFVQYNFTWPKSRKAREMFNVPVDSPGAGPYRDQRSRLPELAAKLAKLRNSLLGGRLPVELILPPLFQATAWEALIHASIPNSKGRVREFMQFCRTAPPLPEENRAPWKSGQCVALLSRTRDMASLERTWAERVAAPRVLTFDERATAIEPPPASLRVIHLVGRTRKGSGARVFQITPDRYFTAGQIPAASACIVIVQCQPVESFERTDTDREQIASLRAFAADLFDGGAATVIFLPQMPSAISDKVASKLAVFCMRRFRQTRFSLLDRVSEVRDLISKSITAEAAALSEAGQKYTHAESKSAGPELIDSDSLNITSGEMSMDVTVWTRL